MCVHVRLCKIVIYATGNVNRKQLGKEVSLKINSWQEHADGYSPSIDGMYQSSERHKTVGLAPTGLVELLLVIINFGVDAHTTQMTTCPILPTEVCMDSYILEFHVVQL